MAEGEQEEESQEDRADRLSRRRKDRSQSAQSDDTGDLDNTVKTDDTENTDETIESEATSSVSLTESRKEQMMHLPEDQHKELHHLYNRLKADYEYEYDENFEMNRHYFPLVLHYGLEQVEQRDVDELRHDLSLPEED